MYQRTIAEWERQRNRLEMEHGELMSRVDYLSDEVRFLNEYKMGLPVVRNANLIPFIDCA
jgi:hypothetical protein